MSGEPILTVIGNVTADPELRFTPSGKPVANFTLASTPRTKQGDEWVDGETTWLRCAAWDALAENVAESIQKGVRVIVQGALSSRSYEKDGQTRTSLELRVDAIGPELRFATARVERAQRGQGGSRPAPQQGGQSAPANDPWATPAPANDPWAVPAGQGDQPPF